MTRLLQGRIVLAVSGTELPSGTVTFLFTDIEGSTRLLRDLGQERYRDALGEHQRLLVEAFDAHGGRVVDTQGDSFFVVFRRAREAVAAAVDGQRALAAHEWPDGAQVSVRMGLHTGEPLAGEERYVGLGVHRAARVGAAGHGGQVLVSQSTRQLLLDDPPPGVRFRDLGVRPLQGLDTPERVFQVVAPGLRQDFAPLRTAQSRRHWLLRTRAGRVGLAAAFLVLVGGATAAALLAWRTAAAKPVLPAANSLAVIDPRSDSVVGDLRLTFVPGGVVAGGDQIWVLDSAGRTATAVDAATLSVQRTVGVDVTNGGRPDVGAHWAGGRTEWVVGAGAVDQLSVDDPASSRISLWNPISEAGQAASDKCRAFVTGVGSTVFVSEGRRFAVLDGRSGSVLRTLTLPAVPNLASETCYGVRYVGGHLLAVRDPDESLGYLDPTTGTFVLIASGIIGNRSQSVAAYLSGAATVWSAGFGSAWIANSADVASGVRSRATLSRLDLGSAEVLTKTVVGQSVAGLVSDPKSGVWFLDGAVEQLVGVDPRSDQPFARIPLRHFPSSIAVGHGRIWVTLQSP